MKKMLSEHGWRLEIDLSGGRIIRLSHNGTQILGTFDRIDGKKGNTHLCVPNFGAEGENKFGLPFHGPARSADWEILESGRERDTLSIAVTLPRTKLYPSSLRVIQKFILKPNSFLHEVTIKNKGKISVPVNVGIHNYWATPAGWEGTMLNGEDISEKIKQNGCVKLRKDNAINLPGNISYRWFVGGFHDAVLWTGRNGGEFDKTYVCIEPVKRYGPHFFGHKESLLDKEKSVDVYQEIIPAQL